MARKSSVPQKQPNGANLGFEAKLWQAADKCVLSGEIRFKEAEKSIGALV
jgi:hypothetical protein